MDYFYKKSFGKKACGIIILLCLLPQLLRIILSCVYVHEISGNIAYQTWVGELCYYGADILGKLSFFSVFGCVIYLVFLCGMKRGGELTILYAGFYIASYFVLSEISDYTLGTVLFGITALLCVLTVVLSSLHGRGAVAAAVITLSVPILGGVIQIYASGVPSADDILYGIFYGVANYSFELLLLLIVCRLANLFRSRRQRRGEEAFSVSGMLISFKNPVMLTMVIFDGIFVLLSAISPTVSIVENLIEYGPPVNASEWMSIISVYAELVIIFVIGYIAMRLAAGIIERAYRAECD